MRKSSIQHDHLYESLYSVNNVNTGLHLVLDHLNEMHYD